MTNEFEQNVKTMETILNFEKRGHIIVDSPALMMTARKPPHFNGKMDRAYLIFVRYKPDQKYIYQQFL